MGEAGQAPRLTHGSPTLAAFAALPSPASASSVLSTPLLECAPAAGALLPSSPPSSSATTAAHAISATPRHDLLSAASDIVPTEPDPVNAASQILTPPATDTLEPDLNMVVGGALAPTHSAPPSPSPNVKARPAALRLPSFDLLGIAAPHPDRYGFGMFNSQTPGGGQDITPESLSSPQAGVEFSNAFESLKLEPVILERIPERTALEKATARPLQSPQLNLGPLTPPEDVPFLDWHNTGFTQLAVRSEEGQPPGQGPEASRIVSSAEVGASGLPQDTTAGAPSRRMSLLWFGGALQTILEILNSKRRRTDSLRVLSHALPSPTPSGHVYSEIISAIQQETAAVESWINVFHAIPGRFNLADLPRSPPSTPGPAVGGQDYFTEKVFDSAVSIADYQENLSHLPRSPRTVVPPGSVDISIVERYIPPSSSNEFATMFDLHGQSILVDRLKELSRDDGSLLFIYPTRAGATTFMREYLSPILDPLLRSMAVVHGLSASLSGTLGKMAAVDQLPDHTIFRQRVENLLLRVSQGGPLVERVFEQRTPPHLVLSHCSRQYVVLDRTTWAANWWTKQEKPRIREAVTRYAREAQTRSSNMHQERPRTSTELMQEVLKGVADKAYPPGLEPVNGIEVSVVVIKRES